MTQKSMFSGVLLMCVGIALLTMNDALAKTLTQRYSPLQIIFLRNLIALPVAFAITLKFEGRKALVSHRLVAHAFRGVLWVGTAIFFFTSIKFLGLAEATTVMFVAPLLITAISAVFLGEYVGWRRWSAVIVGFLGVIIVIRPGGSAFQLVSLLPVAAAMTYAILMISARWVDPRDSVWTLMLYLTGAGSLISGLTMPFLWETVQRSDLWLFLAIAVVGTAGMTMVTQAFRFASAAIIAPLEYTALIWAVLFGWVIWSEAPDFFTYVGALLIVGSGIYVVWRERQVRGVPESSLS